LIGLLAITGRMPADGGKVHRHYRELKWREQYLSVKTASAQ